MEFLSKASVAVALFLTVSASIFAQPKPATGTSAKTPGLHGRFAEPQTHRPGCAASHGGQDRPRTPDPWRRGSPAHTPRRVCGHLRHHVAGRKKPAPRRHLFPGRLQYQDDDGRGDPATGSGGQAQSRRSGVEVRRGRAQRRQDHHRRAAGNAQRSLQLHRCPRNLGEHGP